MPAISTIPQVMYISSPGLGGMMQFPSYYTIPRVDLNSTNLSSMGIASPPPIPTSSTTTAAVATTNDNNNINEGERVEEGVTEMSMTMMTSMQPTTGTIPAQSNPTTLQYIPHVDPTTGIMFYVPMNVPMNEEMMGMMMMASSTSAPDQQQQQQQPSLPPEKEDRVGGR